MTTPDSRLSREYVGIVVSDVGVAEASPGARLEVLRFETPSVRVVLAIGGEHPELVFEWMKPFP